MIGADWVVLSGKELWRVHVIRQVVEKRLTQEAAGTLLGLTEQQIRCLLGRVKQEGDRGLVHRGRFRTGGFPKRERRRS